MWKTRVFNLRVSKPVKHGCDIRYVAGQCGFRRVDNCAEPHYLLDPAPPRSSPGIALSVDKGAREGQPFDTLFPNS